MRNKFREEKNPPKGSDPRALLLGTLYQNYHRPTVLPPGTHPEELNAGTPADRPCARVTEACSRVASGESRPVAITRW